MKKTYYIQVDISEKDLEYSDEILESLSVSLRDVQNDKKLSSKKAEIIDIFTFDILEGKLENTYTKNIHINNKKNILNSESVYADLQYF